MWPSLERSQQIKFQGLKFNSHKIGVYDYKTRTADAIPHSKVPKPVSNIEMITDPFGVQNVLHSLKDAEKHGVLLAGNSGLPGGAVGLNIKILNKLTSVDNLKKKQYGTQEEDVVKNWLLSDYSQRRTSLNANIDLIWDKYGMANYDSTDNKTKQGVNYTNLKQSLPSLLEYLKDKNQPYEKLYADAYVVRDALLSPKTSSHPDTYDFSEAVSTTLFFVAGPNVGAKGSDHRSSTLRTFNNFLSKKENYTNFKKAIKWTYYAALHAMAMENCKIALLCWISGDLYAGPFKKSYGVSSDGSDLQEILNEVLDMRCYFGEEKSTLRNAFLRVIVVSLGSVAGSSSVESSSAASSFAIVDGVSSSVNIKQNAIKLADCYDDNLYKFPLWVLDDLYMTMHEEFAKQTIVFYDHVDEKRFEDVQKMAYQREPVNIGMVIHHDVAKLNKHFKYKESYYKEYYKKYNIIAPNIAIYCETPAVPYSKTNVTEKIDTKEMKIVRILNVVGYGFDSSAQPDFNYFNEKAKKESNLKKHMKLIFDKILACIKKFKTTKPIKWMHLPGFGTGAFAGSNPYVLNVFQELCDIFIPFFESEGVEVDRGNIFTNGSFGGNTLRLYDTWKAHDNSDLPLESRLYINAWDPHSILGNGNFNDASLDGYFGRSTAISVLGWSETNPYMKYAST